MSFDLRELNQLTASIDKLGSAIKPALRRAASLITRSARAGYANGVGPSGQKWKPKADGGLAVQGPASEVTFSARGMSLVGNAPDVLDYHKETRPVFPNGAMPGPWVDILDASLSEELDKVMGKRS